METAASRQIFKQLKELYPDALSVSGYRVTGMKTGKMGGGSGYAVQSLHPSKIKTKDTPKYKDTEVFRQRVMENFRDVGLGDLDMPGLAESISRRTP